MIKKIFIGLACVLLPLFVGALGGIVTSREINTWYVYLSKPFFNPPNYLFGPVWTFLYISMGISLYLIITNQKSRNKRRAYILYFSQLLLNFLWSFLFFSLHQVDLALVEIILMWLCIAWMIRAFYSINKTAAILNIPYLLWVSFATVLNASICFLN